MKSLITAQDRIKCEFPRIILKNLKYKEMKSIIIIFMERGRTHGFAPTDNWSYCTMVKTMTTNKYLKGIKENGLKQINKKLWQRNYYEHIIRNEKEVNKIRQYIINNPFNWETDEDNPVNWHDNNYRGTEPRAPSNE